VRLRVLAISLAVLAALALAVQPRGGVSQAAGSAMSQMRPDEQRLFQLINQYRASLKLVQLQPVQELIEEAQWYAGDMARNDSFSHTHIDSIGRPIEQRFHDIGYLWQRPLAQASSTGAIGPDAAFQQYRQSKAHDAIMRDPRMRALGVGTANAPDTAAQTFWVASFGPSIDPRGPDAGKAKGSSVKKKSKSAKKKASSRKARKHSSSKRR
jgi:uncharacterized protein YkwD